MKKKLFAVLFFLYCAVYSMFGQYLKKDTDSYKEKSLKLDEINLVTSYYSQTGDHSTTLGGVGDESVKEFSSAIDLKFIWSKNPNYIHSFNAGVGLAVHTAASAAWISATGASRTSGNRIYPSLDWSMQDVNKKTEYSAGVSFSGEYNYQSLTVNTGFSKKNNNNGEFGFKLTGSFDQVKMIYAETMAKTASALKSEVYTSILKSAASGGGSSGGSSSGSKSSSSEDENRSSKPRTTLTGAFSYTQVINQQMQVAFLADVTGQFGYLELPYHRVFMSDADSSKLETLPDTRLRLPLALRASYFLGDRFILRGYYRFYTDSWGITAHTASVEVPIKLSPFFSVSPFYRYYTQTASKYFAPFGKHTTSEEYYTSNYSYSSFSANFVGAGLRWVPKEKGIFKAVELRYGYYKQTTDLASNIVTLDLKF